MTSFSISIEGLVGSLVGAAAVSDWGVTSLVGQIPSVTHLTSPVLLDILQVGFFLTCCVMPVLDALLCAALWALPLRPARLEALVVAAEVGCAWSMLEVFAVILLTSLLELDQFAKFSLGHECDAINALLQAYPALAHAVLPPGSEPDCLGIVPALQPGYAVFAAAALLAIPLCLLVIHAANNALEQAAHHASAKPKQHDAHGASPLRLQPHGGMPMTPDPIASFLDGTPGATG